VPRHPGRPPAVPIRMLATERVPNGAVLPHPTSHHRLCWSFVVGGGSVRSPREAPAGARPEDCARRPPGPQESATGLVAAVTAILCLWRCRRVGARPRALGRPQVANAANIEIGDDVLIDSRAGPVQLVSRGRGRLVIGSSVRIGASSRIAASGYVEIGDRTRIGAGCLISDADGASDGAGAEIWIGDGVTLGDGVRVLPGTVIGAGCVVTGGSVVSGRIIPPGALVGGGGAGAGT
jgi:acetyltransferase-like isoleucine patch superfamily enzyme